MAEDFSVNDRRAASRGNSGLILHQSVAQAKSMAHTAALAAGKEGPAPTDGAEARRMGVQRLRNQRVGSAYTGGSGNLSFATQRPRDPQFYYQQNNLPYDLKDPKQLQALRQLCRHVYASHPVMASAIDIFSKWPVVGMELVCKDEGIKEFYETLFFDQLDYEEFLPDLGREYWTVGEAWPFGSFNEDLGVWEDDELLNPDDVFVERSPFLKEPRFYIRLPETLRKVLQTGQPPHEYAALMRSYPQLRHFAYDNARMPVSNILLKQMRFKGDTFNPRGIPIMFRGLRSLIQEEMLNSAQDAIADRLSTPLLLAKIGASASDLGTQNPWIPTEDQIGDFEGALDMALAADFRVLTTHFAVNMESVFGRESLPSFDADFERLTEKQLQVFGLSKTMLSGAGSGETYAADALNRDLVSQLLSTYQRYLKSFMRDRMLVVAEAQGHWDYEERGGRKYPIMEEVLEVDENGETHIVEQPKLLVPDLKLQAMNMKDDESVRQLMEALHATGVPISMKSRLTNIPIDLDDEIERAREEQVQLAVEEQRTRKETYKALKADGLPIPEDLKNDFEPKAMTGEEGTQATGEPTRVPMLGLDDPNHPNLVTTPEDAATPPGQPQQPVEEPGMAQVIPLNQLVPGRTRPPESDEQRNGMPRPAAKIASRNTAAEHLPEPQPIIDPNKADGSHVTDPETGEVVKFEGGLIFGPKHIGLRRYAGVKKDEPLYDDEETG